MKILSVFKFYVSHLIVNTYIHRIHSKCKISLHIHIEFKNRIKDDGKLLTNITPINVTKKLGREQCL